MGLRERIEQLSEDFTSAERKLASALLSDYPFAGLDTIQNFAEHTHTSAPSITRFIQKLGCNGYQDFQRSLIGELKEGKQSPVQLRRRVNPVVDGFLGEFLSRVSETVAAVSDVVTEAQFSRISERLADKKRSIYFVGGRISDPIAKYFSSHLRQIRPDIFHIPRDPEVWPEYLLRMRRQDILVLVDFRRYEHNLAKLAAKAAVGRGTRIFLITDKWLSPIAQNANEIIALPIESGTAWDSYCSAIALTEALISHISEHDWDATKKRIGSWDSLRLDNGETTHEE
jgi:DNA-binding MurR/RpiR family transcriptional regulator